MPVPEFQELMLPILVAVSDGRTHDASEIRGSVAAALSLSDADLSERLPSGKQFVYTIRCAWARTYLVEAGLMTRPQPGRFKITKRGRDTLVSDITKLTATYLYQFPEFKDFRNRWRKRTREAHSS